MAPRKERLTHIRELREERNRRDRELYGFRIQKRKAATALETIKRNVTVLPESRAGISELTKEIAALQIELLRLGQELRDLTLHEERVKTDEQRLTLLDRELRSVGKSIAEVEANVSWKKRYWRENERDLPERLQALLHARSHPGPLPPEYTCLAGHVTTPCKEKDGAVNAYSQRPSRNRKDVW